jgi:hypothetical protein
VLFNNTAGSSIYAYVPSANTNTFLFNSGVASPDIAHTDTKLWVYSIAGFIAEYNITLSPWSAIFSRNITLPAGVTLGNGLGAITNTQLITTNTTTNPQQIINLNITNNLATSSVITTLGADRAVAGDILLTTTNKILVTNLDKNTNLAYLTQYNFITGAFEVEVNITASIPNPLGIFINNSNIYVCNSGGQIYNINTIFPYVITLFNNSGLTIGGSSQVPICCNVNLIR